VSHEQYVTAFYTTAVFKLERVILKWAVRKPSTDEQARQLAAGALDGFAAWTVEKRSADQLLLCDFMGRTRSWLMVEPVLDGPGPATRLYFGSAMTPRRESTSMGWGFSATVPLHQFYSRILLNAARARLLRG
jgi:hypothetical protein